jgi:hypothetical protein
MDKTEVIRIKSFEDSDDYKIKNKQIVGAIKNIADKLSKDSEYEKAVNISRSILGKNTNTTQQWFILLT